MCMGEENCSICYEWNVILDNRGGAIATATFTGSCLNSCSGRGRCNYSGKCNCGLGFYGEDCSLCNYYFF